MQLVCVNQGGHSRNVPADHMDFKREDDDEVIIIEVKNLNRMGNGPKSSGHFPFYASI